MSGDPPSTGTRLARACLSFWIVLLVGWWALVTIHYYRNDQQGILLDFGAFWSAGKLALAGEAMTVWDKAGFQASQATGEAANGAYLPWFYPPTFHMFVTPFGALSFPAAFAVWSLLGVGLFWQMMRQLNPHQFAFTVIAPVVFIAMASGNNALIFGAALALALSQIHNGIVAGMAIALLSMKPGLGPVIALALLAGRKWSVILWTTIGVLGLAAASTALFGLPYWYAFIDNLQLAVDRITPQAEETRRMISWFALSRLDGLPRQDAMIVHLVFLGAAALGTMLLWATAEISDNWRAAALCLAVALTSPHAFHYEMIYVLVAMAFMVRAGLGPVGWVLFALLWLGPIVQVMESPLIPITSFAAPLITATFAYVLLRALRA